MSLDTALASRLRARIAEERQRSVNIVMGGQCADFSQYRYSCGYDRALVDVETIITEILDDMRKG